MGIEDSKERLITPEQLLEQYRNFNNEITSLGIYISNCENRLAELMALDIKKLTEEQRKDILDNISKLDAAMVDFLDLLDSAKKLREKIGIISAEISG